MPEASSIVFVNRSNTVCIDVKEVYGEPKVPKKDWMQFLKADLKLTSDMVVECNMHSLTDMLMVKFSTEEIFTTMLGQLQAGVPWVEKGSVKVFGWSVLETLTNVRIINVSTHMDMNVICQRLKDYGKVVSFREGFHSDWPGVRDGSLIVKMKLDPEAVLPSFLEYGDGEVMQVFCDQAERVCFKCLKKGHIAPYCRNRVRSLAAIGPNMKSWASVVAKQAPKPAQPTPDVTGPTTDHSEEMKEDSPPITKEVKEKKANEETPAELPANGDTAPVVSMAVADPSFSNESRTPVRGSSPHVKPPIEPHPSEGHDQALQAANEGWIKAIGRGRRSRSRETHPPESKKVKSASSQKH